MNSRAIFNPNPQILIKGCGVRIGANRGPALDQPMMCDDRLLFSRDFCFGLQNFGRVRSRDGMPLHYTYALEKVFFYFFDWEKFSFKLII